jgi:serine phosphatase RsbU (regulator of sigma subunit)
MFVVIHQRGPDGRMIARLMAESGPLAGKILPLREASTPIGRSSEHPISLPLPYIDELHCSIEKREQQLLLHDHSDYLGVLVNEEAVNNTVALLHGDRISFPEAFPDDDTDPEGLDATALEIDRFALPEDDTNPNILMARKTVVPQTADVHGALWNPTGYHAAYRTGSRPAPETSEGDPALRAERLQKRKFEVLLAVSKALSRPEDIEVKVNRVLELLFELMDFDRAAILILDDEPKNEEGRYQFKWRSFRDRIGPTEHMELSSTVIQKVIDEADAVLSQNAQNEDWLDGARSVFGQQIRTLVCTPLKTSNSGVLGVIYADGTRAADQAFSKNDLEFFTAFSNQAAIAIENTRLLRVALEKERMEQDIRVARRIQRWLYPQKAPDLDGFAVAGDSFAMDQVGGDYFDFVQLGEHHLALVLGDVSGHGISSALVMTMTRSVLRGTLSEPASPAAVLTRVNQLVSEDMITRMFVTMVLVFVDLRTGEFVFSSAGHEPLLQYTAANHDIVMLERAKRGGPLGMSRWARLKPRYKDIAGKLEPGDSLFLYSDGFPEATNPASEQWGLEPIQDILLENAAQEPAETLKILFEQVRVHFGESIADDDTTGILLKRLPA